jgi:hypothetical protein
MSGDFQGEIKCLGIEAAILKEGHFFGFTNQGKHDSR